MAKWWMGLAVIAMGMSAVPAGAQGPEMPNMARPALMPEPIPGGEMPGNGMPQNPAACAPDSPFSLPCNIPTAWSEPILPRPAIYTSLGWIGLARQQTGHNLAAFQDPQNLDTGNEPPRGSPILLDFHDITPRLSQGVNFTVGYHLDVCAVEFTGFYVGQTQASRLIAQPGTIDTPFYNFPLGFEGDNNMFLQDDIAKITLKTALGSAEFNFRRWLDFESTFSWILGIRYVDLYERFGFYVGDDDLTVLGANGLPDPTRQATYTTTTNNRILAPQLGFEWNKPLTTWLAISMRAKGAWGVNFLTVDTELQRGDGYTGFNGSRSETMFSHLYEAGFFADFSVTENTRLRVGYNMMWLLHVAEATSVLDYNLANTNGKVNNNGSVFFAGPSVEFHVLF